MRVISGKYKGKILSAPEGNSVRPTTDRIKETIFNILQGYCPEAECLDLFAGSGALGIEALSKGANFVDFVDIAEGSLKHLKDNLKGVDADTYKVTRSDFLVFLKSCKKAYDLIFIDAPYKSNMGSNAVLEAIELNLLKDYGLIMYEHSTDIPFEFFNDKYSLRTKKMGNTTVEFIEKI